MGNPLCTVSTLQEQNTPPTNRSTTMSSIQTRTGSKRKAAAPHPPTSADDAIPLPPKPAQPTTTDGPQKKKQKKTAADSLLSASLSKEQETAAEEAAAALDPKDNEELELEELVFGGDVTGVRERLVEAARGYGVGEHDERDERGHSEEADQIVIDGGDGLEGSDAGEDFGFFIDTGGKHAEEIHDSTTETEPQPPVSTTEKLLSSDLPAAWSDDDDVPVNIIDSKRLRKLRLDYSEKVLTGKEYEQRLRQQFVKMHPTPQWATIKLRDQENGGSSSDDLLRILRTSMGIVDKGRQAKQLSPESLDIVRMKDANQMAYSQSVVQSIEFHPTAPVLLTCGYDKTLRLFQIDGRINPKIQSIHIKDLPLHTAHFSPDGKEVVMTGKRKFFYSYDVEKGVVMRVPGIRGRDETSLAQSYISPNNKYIVFLGRDGYIILVSKDTKQWIGNLKMNGRIVAVQFSADGESMYSLGGDGEIYIWNLETRKCTHRFFDEGCVKATCLAVSSTDLIATGSDTGVINIYSPSAYLNTPHPTPLKTILNLTTPITSLLFSPDSQILAMASRDKKDALKLLHVPTRRVFLNWPTGMTPLGYVNSVAFSPGGGYLAVGNDKGRVGLWRLAAYEAL
ncbi:WD40-repeat-containing domain protein [Fimicolochytrium jonesii]|uniref:WD40-repeat-containing domain protein n=1 Tax=Fimicolochytrium jonesii TaxID=1396493 RepID=UPI0022FF3B8D|nr:WD40-repeat-containing domain protein [Fimicolochytrium jonesii]KAI8826861.1 WD40-repeat-containing domain protein [Fimicolochytrium jonesii]